MKPLYALALAMVALAATAAQARASSPSDRRLGTLERQVAQLIRESRRPTVSAGPQVSAAAPLAKRVASLEKQVKTLKKQVSDLQDGLTLSLVFSDCLSAATADALTGTWSVVEQFAGRPLFGPQPTVDDTILTGPQTACGLVNISRQKTAPPSLGVFSALTAIFR